MARIKGKYVATVVIDFDYDDTSNLRPFDEMREIVIDGRFLEHITDVMKEEYELENASTVSVETQFADLYRVEEETE